MQKKWMTEYAQTWRKKLRLQILVDIAKNELESGKETNQVYERLDEEMKMRWKLVITTRKQYLDDVKKILTIQNILVI